MRVILALAALALVSPALAQEAGDARRGLEFAKARCSECHAVFDDDAPSPRAGLATFRTIAGTPGMTALALRVWLQSPHKDMPNLIVPPSDRDDVIAYILSLKGRPATK